MEHVEEVLDKNGNGVQRVYGDFNTDLLSEKFGARVTFENMMNSQRLDLLSLRGSTDRYFPIRQLKRRKPKKSWVTNRIKRHIAIKDKLCQFWLKTKSGEQYEKYKKKGNAVDTEIKIAKRNDVQSNIDRNSPKEFFRYIKSTKGENSQMKISSKPSADDFNNYFITACDQRKVTPVTSKCVYDQGYQPQTLFFYRVTEIEIANLIATLKNKNCVGSDGYSLKILKKTAPIINSYLKTPFKKFFAECVFPRISKIAKIVPLFVAGDRKVTSNYRPFSILGNLSKIFEKIIDRRLMKYFEKISILSDNQYGFRKKKDSIQGATFLWKPIQANWKAKMKTNCVFVDFRKAFDSVDYEVLLQNFYHGVRGTSHKLIANYFAERFQYVRVNDKSSAMKSMKCGVPQGSILGPLLFLIYIDDLGAHENWQSEIINYADDSFDRKATSKISGWKVA